MEHLDVEISDAAWGEICSLLRVHAIDTDLRGHLGALKAHLRNELRGGGDARTADVRRIAEKLQIESERFAKVLDEVVRSENPSSTEAEFWIGHIRNAPVTVSNLLTTVTAFGVTCGDVAVRFRDGGGPGSQTYRDFFLYHLDQVLNEVSPRPIDRIRAGVALSLMKAAGETHPPAPDSIISYLRRIRSRAISRRQEI